MKIERAARRATTNRQARKASAALQREAGGGQLPLNSLRWASNCEPQVKGGNLGSAYTNTRNTTLAPSTSSAANSGKAAPSVSGFQPRGRARPRRRSHVSQDGCDRYQQPAQPAAARVIGQRFGAVFGQLLVPLASPTSEASE